MPTVSSGPIPVPRDVCNLEVAEDDSRDEAEVEHQPVPPPLPPDHAAAAPPVAPTVPSRVLPYIKARDLKSRDAVNLQKTAALFGLVITYKAHTKQDRRHETKVAWIKVIDDAYSSNPTEPGPLAAHRMFEGHECQGKTKKLILEAAKYYAGEANKNASKEPLCDLADNSELVSNCEVLGLQIHNERVSAQRGYKEHSVAAAQAKEQHKRVMEAAEEYVAVPPARGVAAPPGVVVDVDIAEALGHLGAQPKSRLRPPLEDLSNETTDDCESVLSVVVIAEVTPAKPSKPANGSMVRDNLAKERDNARAAAKVPAAHARKTKKKKKEGKKTGGHYRPMAGHADFVDIVDGVSKHMVAQGDKMTELLDRCLTQLPRHNEAAVSPRTNTQIMAEVTACGEMINNLKRAKQEAQDDNDTAEFEDCRERLGNYYELRRKLEGDLFKTRNEA